MPVSLVLYTKYTKSYILNCIEITLINRFRIVISVET